MSDENLPKWLPKEARVQPQFVARYNDPRMVELTSSGKRRATLVGQHVFVWDMHRLFMKVGMDEEQARYATANAFGECTAGVNAQCNNFMGIKIKPDLAKRHGFFEKEGHVKGGDTPIVRYAAFNDAEDCARYWRDRYTPMPKPGETWPTVPEGSADFRPAGLAFHRVMGNTIEQWFDRIIESGYKGEVTKGDPAQRAASNASFQALVKGVEALYRKPFCGTPLATQSILKALSYYTGKLDGVIGPASQQAIVNAQRVEGLPQTGAMDPMLGKSLLRKFIVTLPVLT